VAADQDLYRQGTLPCRVQQSLEVSRELAQRLVSIPCHPEMTDHEVARVVDVLAAPVW
jgi:dTDP-4-amino-4,6-dideoxygalactose transaminase